MSEQRTEPFTELVQRLQKLAETEAKRDPSFRRWLRSRSRETVAGDGGRRVVSADLSDFNTSAAPTGATTRSETTTTETDSDS